MRDPGDVPTEAPVTAARVPRQRDASTRVPVAPGGPVLPSGRGDVLGPLARTRPTGHAVELAEWTAPAPRRLALAFLLLMAVAGCGVLGLRALTSPLPAHLGDLLLGLVGAGALGLALLAVSPQVVRVKGPVVSVHRRRDVRRFDLGDLAVSATLTAAPDDPGWTLLLRSPGRTEVTVRRRDVDATVLDRVVRHHRSAVVATATGVERVAGTDPGSRDLDGHRRTA